LAGYKQKADEKTAAMQRGSEKRHGAVLDVEEQ